MARRAAVLFTSLVLHAHGSSSVFGVQKVIQMMTDMTAKAIQEKNDEQVAYAEFETWCSQESTNLASSIKKGGENIELLGASIDKLGSDISQLGDDIAQLNKDKAKFIVSAFIGLLDGDKQDADYSPPEANAYEFQSGGVVAMLKKLRDEFRAKLSQSQKEEMNSAHASEMMLLDLNDVIENTQKDASRRTQKKSQKAEKKAMNEKELQSTITVKAADESTLSDTKAECKEKSMSYQEKQQLRTEEIEALRKATEIMQSDDVSGSAEKHLDLAQMQQKTVAALLQAAGGASEQNQGVHRRVRDFLASEGRRLNSQGLALLAQKIMADPFAKVKKMIDGMITRLLEEANEDAKHEGFCDEEMGKSKITRDKLSSEIDGLLASIDGGKATVLSLSEEISELSKDVAGLEKAMKEATGLRTAEKAKNAATVEDAQAAAKAVAAATAVLKDFYDKAATATGFLQVQAPSPREFGLKTGVKMGTDER